MQKPGAPKKRLTLSQIFLALNKDTSSGGQNGFNVYTYLAYTLRKRANPNCPTMQVCLTKSGYQLEYNEKFLDQISLRGISMVVKHEMMHILLRHIPRQIKLLTDEMSEAKRHRMQRLSAIAVDYAVNSLLVKWNETNIEFLKSGMGPPVLDEKGIQLVTKQGHRLSKFAAVYPTDLDLPECKTYEWYLQTLMANYKELAEKANSYLKGPPLIKVHIQKDEDNEDGEGEDGEGNKSDKESDGSDGSDSDDENESEDGDSDGSGECDSDSDNIKPSQSKGKGKNNKKKDNSKGKGKNKGEGSPGQESDEYSDEVMDIYLKMHRHDNFSGLKENVDKMDPSDLASAIEAAEDNAATTVQRHVQSMKSRGLNPGNFIEELCKDMLRPKFSTNWKQVLKTFASTSRSPNPYRTYRRPKRREISGETFRSILWPGKHKDPTWNIVFGIDTSGSMSSKDILEVIGVLLEIKAVDTNIKIKVIEADTSIHHEYDLEKLEDANLKVHGRGGTDFDCVFRRVKELRETDLLIYATDGYAPLPSEEARIHPSKLLWVVTSGGVIPGDYNKRVDENYLLQDHPTYGKILQIRD